MERQLIDAMRQHRRIAVLTGAGMSTESGLPDFRSPGGLWRNHRPEELVSVSALLHRPLLFYEFYRMRLDRLREGAPHAGHFALAELEKRGRVTCVVTQNVDGLHIQAGSRNVAEIHGSLREARCHDCRRPHPITVMQKPVESEEDLPRCECGGLIRPGVVLFGEDLPQEPFQRAVEAVENCDALLVIGSSLLVHPAASLPQLALNRGAKLWIVNLEPTPYDASADILVCGKAGEVLSKVMAS